MKKKVIVIGSGFAGLSAACHLAKAGCQVTLLEKNETLGGRARQFTTDEGLVYDMGPSWYWMPDVFDQFFESFNKKTSDYYNLIRLDPSYQVIFQENKILKVPAGRVALKEEFEKIESGSGKNLDVFLKSAQYKYQVGMNEFVHKPSNSIFEFADLRVLKSLFKLKMFSSISKEINQLFKSPIIKQILEFPVLFLGAKPENTPALYSLMNYA
ncbi:MAG: FAD-dependent oxidoreductase, partial [Saprospiraceae bacterium]|nr:FAD-dependent oxidoreductase [Saprospiraceae bacterium]